MQTVSGDNRDLCSRVERVLDMAVMTTTSLSSIFQPPKRSALGENGRNVIKDMDDEAWTRTVLGKHKLEELPGDGRTMPPPKQSMAADEAKSSV